MSRLFLHKVGVNTKRNGFSYLATSNLDDDNEIHESEKGDEINFLRRVLERLENLDEDEALIIRKTKEIL